MARVRVPSFAKKNARVALKKRKSFDDPPGTSVGVNRARQLIRESRIRESTANEIVGFLKRHLAQLEPGEDRRRVALRLWGDDGNGRFLQYLERKL